MKLALAAVSALALAAHSSPARADAAKDVDAALRAHLKTFGNDTIAGLTTDGKVLIENTEQPPSEAFNYGVDLLDNFSGSQSIALGPTTIVVVGDGHAAWFHARATIKYKEVVGEGVDDWAKPRTLRISGIAVSDGGWKIARIAYTTPEDDKDMIELAGYADPPIRPASGPPTRTGDDAITTAAAAWFPGGLVAGASSGAKLVANGTAPSEFGADRAAALKLAKSWDRLKLGATAIAATRFGDVALVRATVRLPVKPKHPNATGPLAAEMTLYAIVVAEGGGWRWVSLDWTARILK